MAVMVRDEGGLILPMFNDFIDARTDKVMGWVPDSEHGDLQPRRADPRLARRIAAG